MMKLRPYQQKAIDMLYQWMSENDGHPCLELPTGAGKSIIVAELCKHAVKTWPSTRMLMLTHQKELIEQNAAKLRQHWPNAPLGIYSASVGKKQANYSITFAGIQSLRKKAALLGYIDLCLIDECHLVGHKDEGTYRELINDLLDINPSMRVIGLTATPYRLGHGMITDAPALFSDIIKPVSVYELVQEGYLARLRSRLTDTHLSVDGVGKRGGEYIESQLQKAVDVKESNEAIVQEVIRLAEDRKAWLFFCAGVEHAKHIAETLNANGIASAAVHGGTPKAERERLLRDFMDGKLRAMTNANVLTTGFDYPDIDLIAMLRPTMSASLYVQMAGRGMRLKSHTDHCLVLDFAGVVEQHGPITNVQPPKKTGGGNGLAPAKPCPECHEILHLSAVECSNCGYQFPLAEKKDRQVMLHQDDIMGEKPLQMAVSDWLWEEHISQRTGKKMLRVRYYPKALSDKIVTEYLTVLHGGAPGMRAMRVVTDLADKLGVQLKQDDDTSLAGFAERISNAPAPDVIEYTKNGKFFDVKRRLYEQD